RRLVYAVGPRPPRVHVARRNQRRAAGRRHARAAHHLHGHRADAAARHRRQAAAGAPRHAGDRRADRGDGAGRLPYRAPRVHRQGKRPRRESPRTHPPEDGRARSKGSVPARRRDGAVSGSDGSVRRAQGRRRAERRHGGAHAGRAVMDVTDVLRDRMQQPDGLQRMLTVSVAAHLALAATLIVAPGGLLHRDTRPATVMTISLGGGGERAENGGMTQMGGRPVQEVKPPDEPVKREAIRPPAAKAPEMTMPLPNAKVTKTAPPPSKPVKSAPEEARGKTPTRGAQVMSVR